ncbi:hypothetical protein ACSOQS_003096 [Yersinia enterocolitica]|uniref:hypothetical protein n=1 Tax=Yersinia massiliensis TaxID=419257 RepID=UPI0011808BF3|nr:hypothetical protein [Yersinia massiliensis]EKN3458719.1 hypothetical protein [Yersinia enterocolitica]EKN4159108.1 hypothetical protein [Yersinia enterocolitica]
MMIRKNKTGISVTRYVNKAALGERLIQIRDAIRKLQSFQHSESMDFQSWVKEAIHDLLAEYKRIRPQAIIYLRRAK